MVTNGILNFFTNFFTKFSPTLPFTPEPNTKSGFLEFDKYLNIFLKLFKFLFENFLLIFL